jgi:hypothetical protein
VAWDAVAEKIWFRKNSGNWNGDASANPATGTNGLDISSFTDSVAYNLFAFGGTVGGLSAIIRTEAADLTLTAPSGFTSWMGETLTAGPTARPPLRPSLVLVHSRFRRMNRTCSWLVVPRSLAQVLYRHGRRSVEQLQQHLAVPVHFLSTPRLLPARRLQSS